MSESLVYEDATTLVRRLRERDLSSVELMTAYYDRIDRIDPVVNAIPTRLDRDEALALARTADAKLATGEGVGPLHGLPIAIKDLQATAGMRTTMGSPLLERWVPAHDAQVVKRIREAGALIFGKTNTPEFGAGSHSFNPIFGTTRNPYDRTKTAGGSSGGAGAALASGLLPVADGSDLGGSLRNPGSFNNVVGFRPSVGRVPGDGQGMGWLGRLAVDGPMGRTVADAALLLSAIAGHDPGDPLSIDEDPARLAAPFREGPSTPRIGWGGDLGFLPVEHEVLEICEKTMGTLEALGAEVTETAPDFRGAMAAFQTQRALVFAQNVPLFAAANPDWRSVCKDTVVWNVDQGLALTSDEVARSDAERHALYRRVMTFFEDHDFLALPSAQVLPFDLETEWVREIEGVQMETYVDWMEVCCIVTLTGLPAISVPAGFSTEGLPVGLQLIGRPRADREVLALAQAFEQATGHGRIRPVFDAG